MVSFARHGDAARGEGLIPADGRTVQLPADLCREAEQRFAHRFASLEELLIFVLHEMLRAESTKFDQAEQRIVEQRLKDLGYI